MRLCMLKSILMLIIFQIGYLSLVAQHYVFIEAEGQQPFYLKMGGETYSSSASGFIILSKLNKPEIDLIIGFPNNLYPEVAFKLNAVTQDKGFALKQVQGKGWTLVDRLTAAVVSGGAVDRRQVNSVQASTSTGFAELLADATGDKTLLEKTPGIGISTEKPTAAIAKPKTTTATPKSQTPVKPPTKSSTLGIVRSYIQSDDSSLLRIAFFEKGAKNNWDTIIVEIEKAQKDSLSNKPIQLESPEKELSIISVSTKEATTEAPRQSSVEDIPVPCSNIIALPKDIRELQRKLAKAASFEDQLALATKALSEKCFSTKQIKELGTIFWEEQNKLTFYSRLKKYVSDPSLYGELEESFMQEGSKKAFREFLKNQQL